MSRRPRNWAVFYRARQDRERQALAEGQHRPPPLITTPPEDDQTATPDQDQDDD